MVLVALNVAAIFFHIRSESSREWATHSFSGVVVAISPGLLKVKDVRGTQKLFQLTEETSVRRGTEVTTTAVLVPGSYVVVDADGNTARTVRMVVAKTTSEKK